MAERISCNICNSDKSIELIRLNSFFVNKCLKCGLVYVNPQPSKDQIVSHYSFRYNPTPDFKYNGMKKSDKMLHVVEQKIKKGKLLEVGCSYGFFLNTAKNSGWDVKGIEIAKGPAEYARNLNIEIIQKELMDAKFSEDEFDVIAMWHVLEHVRDPFLNLLEINRILKKKGFLFLTIPNINSVVAKVCGKHWSWLDPPTHLYYFSPETIIKLLGKAGFKCLYIKTREGDSGNPFYRILRSIVLRLNLSNLSKKDDSNENLVGHVNTKSFFFFLKASIKCFIDLIYVFFKPVFWLFWRCHLGAEIFVCAQKQEVKNQ